MPLCRLSCGAQPHGDKSCQGWGLAQSAGEATQPGPGATSPVLGTPNPRDPRSMGLSSPQTHTHPASGPPRTLQAHAALPPAPCPPASQMLSLVGSPARRSLYAPRDKNGSEARSPKVGPYGALRLAGRCRPLTPVPAARLGAGARSGWPLPTPLSARLGAVSLPQQLLLEPRPLPR